MPSRHIKHICKMKPDDIDMEFMNEQWFECPQCNYRVPIKNEHFDYKILYDDAKKWNDELRANIDDFLLELQEEVPEAKIYLHNQKQNY